MTIRELIDQLEAIDVGEDTVAVFVDDDRWTHFLETVTVDNGRVAILGVGAGA